MKSLLNVLASVSLLLLPTLTLAQNRPQAAGPGGGPGGGGAPMGQIGAVVQVVKELDLSDDQQAKLRAIVQQTQSDVRDAIGDLQNASPQQRAQKMQDLQKIMTDMKKKVEDLLTPEQKAKYYPALAKATVSIASDRLKTLQSELQKSELSTDDKAQVQKVIDSDSKSLEGLKSDAEGVKDSDGTAEVEQKVSNLQQQTRKQIIEAIGLDNAQQLLQSLRPGSARRGTGRGATTKPADN